LSVRRPFGSRERRPGEPVGVTQQVEVQQGARRPVRQLVAASIGNAVEWYDWYA